MSAIMNISLYIPHIFANYSKEDVAKVFEDQKIGKVKNIDFISKLSQDGKAYNAAYIHFEHWYDNIAATNFQERVINLKKEARLMYEDPWYWIVLENKARKVVPGQRKPRIDLGEFPVLSTPAKVAQEEKCPAAPVKAKTQPQPVAAPSMNLCDEFDAAQLEMNAEMDEIEALIEEEESHLVSVDGRYVHTLEDENTYFRAQNFDLQSQLVCLQNALYVEQIKSQTLADAIGKMKKE